MHPVLDKFATQMNGRVDVYKIDIDSPGLEEILLHYNIRSVPTLIFFRRGQVLWRTSGAVSYEQLVNVLNELEQRCETELGR